PGSLRDALAGICADGLVTFSGDQHIQLQSQIAISRSLTIDGGTHAITVDGGLTTDPNVDGGVFAINAPKLVTISNLTIINGIGLRGGAIYTASPLALDHVTVKSSQGSDGGGIFAEGAIIVTNSSLISNTASIEGGGITVSHGGQATISDTSFVQNSTSNYAGGGFYQNHDGTSTI